MKRRDFLFGSLLVLFAGCASNIVTYYAQGDQEFNKLKREILENGEKIVEYKYDKTNQIYEVKVKGNWNK